MQRAVLTVSSAACLVMVVMCALKYRWPGLLDDVQGCSSDASGGKLAAAGEAASRWLASVRSCQPPVREHIHLAHPVVLQRRGAVRGGGGVSDEQPATRQVTVISSLPTRRALLQTQTQAQTQSQGQYSPPAAAAVAAQTGQGAATAGGGAATGGGGVEGPPKVWLYLGMAAHFKGAAMQLEHYMTHYLDKAGFSPQHFILVLNFRGISSQQRAEYQAVQRAVARRGLTFVPWGEEYSSLAHIKVKYEQFKAHGVQPHDWIAITDLDEFHQYPVAPVTRFVERVAGEGANWVQGWLVDRVAEGGALPDVAPQPAMEQQFPLSCLIVPHLYRGAHSKVGLARAYLRGRTGNHDLVETQQAAAYYGPLGVYELTPYAQYPACYLPLTNTTTAAANRPSVCGGEVWAAKKASVQIGISHYKWTASVIQSAQRRVKHYKSPLSTGPGASGKPRIPWFTESEAVLTHVTRNAMRINISAFGCKRKGAHH